MLPSAGFKTSSCHIQAQCPKLEFVTFSVLRLRLSVTHNFVSEETVRFSQNKDLVLFISIVPSMRPRAVDYTHFFPLLYFSHPPIFPHSFPSLVTSFFFLLPSLFLFLIPPIPFFSLLSFPLLPFYLKTFIRFYTLYNNLWNPYYLPLAEVTDLKKGM